MQKTTGGWTVRIIILAVALALLPAAAKAATLAQAHTVAALFENDFYFGEDRWNSADLKLAWLSPPLDGLDNQPADYAAWNTPLAARQGFWRGLAVSAGISILTPEDLDANPAPADDRPYAGFTYLSVAGMSRNERQHDELELTVGLVGPDSQAEKLQNAFHDDDADGWDDQLDNEVAFLLAARRVWRVGPLPLGGGWGVELLPRATLAGGTLAVYAGLGAEVRLGCNLPTDFGTPLAQPASGGFGPSAARDPRLTGDFSAYLFLAAEGRAVARNLFLDGNTFGDSAEIEREPLVADLYGGLGLSWGGAQFTVAPALRTSEFEGQPEAQTFVSARLALTF